MGQSHPFLDTCPDACPPFEFRLSAACGVWRVLSTACRACDDVRVRARARVCVLQVRLPLLDHRAAAVTVLESGAVVWAAAQGFRPGVDGVRVARADEAAMAGPVIAVVVGSGRYSFSLLSKL